MNAVVFFALATLVLFLHASYVNVVIHPFFFTPQCIVLLLVPGGALSVFLLFHNTMRNPSAPLGRGGILGPLFLPFFLGAIGWIVLAKTPAWLAAVAVGTPHSEVREFHVRTLGGSRGGCRSRAEVIDDLRLMPSHLCVGESIAHQYDSQRVLLRLSGDRTPLGFRITHFEHVERP